MTDTNIAERVRKLLNQAENTDNEAEAAIFMEKAQTLSTLYSIDLAKARHATIAKQRTVPIMRRVSLGKRGTRGLNTHVSLIGGIASANGVQYNIAHNSTYVNLFGFEEDIDVVEALYVSLMTQMVTASLAFKKLGEWKNDTVFKASHYTYFYVDNGAKATAKAFNDYENTWNNSGMREVGEMWHGSSYVPIAWLTARLDFQQAFAERVGMRLYMAKRDAEAQAIQESADSAGTELVLVDKKKTVNAFYNEKSTARGSYRGGRSGYSSFISQSAGDNAGRSARLSNQGAVGGQNKAIA